MEVNQVEENRTGNAGNNSGDKETCTVKFYKADKGYGFMTDDNGKDLFFHISVFKAAGIEDEPKQGQKFDIYRGNGRDGKERVVKIINK